MVGKQVEFFQSISKGLAQSLSHFTTERFTDLGMFDFRLEPIFSTASAASKNNAQFKRDL
jgi:hypothetical protein